MLKRVLLVGSLSLALLPIAAFGWGSYGHEQINFGAIQALKGTDLGACLATNRDYLVRLGITPDFDWKWVGTQPTDPALKTKKHDNDRYEHPLHFFEADAFIPPASINDASIKGLPSDSTYSKDFPTYKDLLAKNVDEVVKVDPSKKLNNPSNPTAKEVTEHGTAPWRVMELYDLAVDALAKNDLEMGLFYMGALGHYVGDMSQPFHATLNFDGQYYVPLARGIHSTFEETILEDAAKATDRSQMDKMSKLWSSFKATNDNVMKEVNSIRSSSGLSTIGRDEVIPQILGLVATGYPSIPSLLADFTFAKTGNLGAFPGMNVSAADLDPQTWDGTNVTPTMARAMAHSPSFTTPKKVRDAFSKMDYLDPKTRSPKETVLEFAAERMGASSALLAQIWLSIYEAAKAKNGTLSNIENCKPQAFDVAKAINQYPKPVYLPKR